MKNIQVYQRADTEQGQEHQSQEVLQSVQNKIQNIASKQDQHQDKPEEKSFRSQKGARKQNIIFYLLFIIVFVLIGCALYYVLQDQAAGLKFKKQKNNEIQNLQQNNSEKFQQKQAIKPKVQIRSQQKQTQIKPIENNYHQQNQVSKQIKQETGIQFRLFKHEDIFNNKISKQLNQLLKDTLYDPHQFIRQDQFCQHKNPVVLHLAEQNKQTNLERPLLKITKSQEELQKIIENMKYNQDRPKRFPKIKAVTRVSQASIDLAYFFHALNYDPNNQDYLEAQYYRYNKLYSIGNYKRQLPLCITLVGKNTKKYQDKLYSTLERQNYTNYRIVHIDDNSNDGTQEKIMQMIKQKPQFGKKITFVSQKIRRNQFYNRNMAIQNYCPQDSIVLDLDADDWIIGNQVFQLVNSIYQFGKLYKNMKYDIWALYLGHIIYQPHCPCILPNIDGQIPQQQFTQHTYRSSGKWRTTQLRTFLRKIYLKIDVNDFVDKLSLKGSYYLQSPDTFMHSSILELSGPKHLKVLDQFVYYYTTSLSNMRRRDSSLDIHYAGYTAKTLTPYQSLESLNDAVRRVKNYKVPQNVWNDKQIKTKEMQRRRDKILQQIQEMILNNSNI